MHLEKLPTIFIKDGEERKVYFTIQARELSEEGWIEKAPRANPPMLKTAKKPEPDVLPRNKQETLEEIKTAAKIKSELIIDTK